MMQQTHFQKAFHADKHQNQQQTAYLRIRVYLCQHEPIISHLIAEYGLSISVIRAVLEDQIFPRQFDLELHGTVAQIQQGLAYLASVSLAVQGKPNADGDS
jgi:L-aspartate semialdehyde sulfurtransferase ferredoxin